MVGVCVCGRLKRSLCGVGAGGGWHVVAVESGLPRRADREDYSCSAAASASRYVRFSVCTHRLLVLVRVCVMCVSCCTPIRADHLSTFDRLRRRHGVACATAAAGRF